MSKNCNGMAKEEYYSEETLVEKVQGGEYGWADYVCHHSKAWNTKFEKYCRLRDLPMNDEAALRFLDLKQEEMEEALANGDA